jgi:hypothetical protein
MTSTPLVTPTVEVITINLYSQLSQVMGLKHPGWLSWILYQLLKSPVRRMSGLLVELDLNIPQVGLNAAVNIFRHKLISNVCVMGADKIPAHGPVMVICNHPAAYDVAILASAIPRDDLQILASDIPIIQMFPNISSHIIPVPYHIPSRLQTIRSAIQHLQRNEAIFLFPRGNVEPDPCVSPGAEESLLGWSPSIELFLRKVPDTCTVVAMASGMLSAKWFKNPFIRLWKKFEQRQKVAEIFQIATQLITGRPAKAMPKVNFSDPLSVKELGGVESPQGTLISGMVAHARLLLSEHHRD